MNCVSLARRILARVAVLFPLTLTAARAADDAAAAAAGPVVELPKFVVTDSRELPPPESWRYATMPGFEILSNASDKATQRLQRDFDMFRQALSVVWPLPDRSGPPTALIICGRGNKFDAFAPEGGGVEMARASMFLKKGERTAIVIDFQATTLNVLNVDDSNDAATGTDSSLMSVEHDKQLYREYVRYLLSRSEPRLPAWLEEGLAQIIMKMRFERRYIEYARLEDPNAVSAQAAMVAELNAAAAAEGEDSLQLAGAPAEDRDFAAALQRRRLIDMDVFFGIKHDAPEALNPLGNNRWAKQAYAFVHMCLYGYHGKYQKAFAQFLQRLAREPVSEAMFKECFKMSYKQMLLEIRSYCDMTVYETKIFQSKKGGPDILVPPEPLAFRDATQSEIGRIKGETLLLAGRDKAARAELIAPYMRGERDPALLASLGLYENTYGEAPRARKFLEAAVADKTPRAEAYLELARLRFADAAAKPAGAEGKFSPAQTAAIVSLLETGRRLPPHQPALYELLGETWMRSAATANRDQAISLIDGARIFPGRLKLAYQAALVCASAGLLEPAHSLVDHGLKYAPDAAARARFEALKKALPPEPARSAAAPATEAKATPAGAKK